jgi:long-chain acyl-CoA synthetase
VLLIDILPRLKDSAAKLCFLSDRGQEEERSFGDLHEEATALVHALSGIGVKSGMRVGLLAPNSSRWIAWDLALLAAGCVSVALPQEKLGLPIETLIERLALNLVAVDPYLVAPDDLRPACVVPVAHGEFEPGRAALQRSPAGDSPLTHSLAFSSGTTGKTKGLVISRSGTERLINLYEAAFGVFEGDRMLTFLPFANYQQRMTYYFCLYHGIDFVYVPFPRLFAGLKQYAPTYVIAPPVFYEATHSMALAGVPASADADESARLLGARLRDLLGGRIRYLITGMAPIKRQTLDFFWTHGVSLFEAFGITEAGMVCWNKPGQVRLGTVGKPAEEGSVSLSTEGEVIVTRDALLSLGYFDSSDEDARSTFLAPNAVATGDIARFDDEGFLTIVGRKKDAIITKAGEKFHPEPIEALIQRAPGVKAAVVLGGDPLPGLAALVVVQDPRLADVTEAIRAHIAGLAAELPPSQRVRQVVFTDQDFTIENGMRTKNMKLNRRAILQRFVEQQAAQGGDNHA